VASPSPLFLAGGKAAITISLRLQTVANRISALDLAAPDPKWLGTSAVAYAEQKLNIRYYCRRRLANAP
jgi:hypothetical protein